MSADAISCGTKCKLCAGVRQKMYRDIPRGKCYFQHFSSQISLTYFQKIIFSYKKNLYAVNDLLREMYFEKRAIISRRQAELQDQLLVFPAAFRNCIRKKRGRVHIAQTFSADCRLDLASKHVCASKSTLSRLRCSSRVYTEKILY